MTTIPNTKKKTNDMKKKYEKPETLVVHVELNAIMSASASLEWNPQDNGTQNNFTIQEESKSPIWDNDLG